MARENPPEWWDVRNPTILFENDSRRYVVSLSLENAQPETEPATVLPLCTQLRNETSLV